MGVIGHFGIKNVYLKMYKTCTCNCLFIVENYKIV